MGRTGTAPTRKAPRVAEPCPGEMRQGLCGAAAVRTGPRERTPRGPGERPRARRAGSFSPSGARTAPLLRRELPWPLPSAERRCSEPQPAASPRPCPGRGPSRPQSPAGARRGPCPVLPPRPWRPAFHLQEELVEDLLPHTALQVPHEQRPVRVVGPPRRGHGGAPAGSQRERGESPRSREAAAAGRERC